MPTEWTHEPESESQTAGDKTHDESFDHYGLKKQAVPKLPDV